MRDMYMEGLLGGDPIMSWIVALIVYNISTTKSPKYVRSHVRYNCTVIDAFNIIYLQ